LPESNRFGYWLGRMQDTVLVVEDEADMVDLLRYHLSKAGFGVLIARDGLTGLPGWLQRMVVRRRFQESRACGVKWAKTLWDDFQRRNLGPFKLEKESKVNGATGKVSNQVARDDYLPVLLFAGDRLTGVLILCRGVRLPLFDCGPALVGLPLVLHDGILSETLRNGLAVSPVCSEVSRDGLWQAG
jgi:hypothetical protein